MDNSPSLENKIKAAIEASGKSRLTVAEETGIPYTTLTRRLRDGMTLTLGELAKLADVLDVAPEELVAPTTFSPRAAAHA